MPIHRFAVDTGQLSPDKFASVLESMRSDVEQRHTKIAIHDESSADILVARQRADEIIFVSGAEVEVYARTDNADVDSVWDADADPTYWPAVLMKAYFKPSPVELELKKWGADLDHHKQEVVFSHRQLYEEFGERMLRVGDVLKLPYNAAAINPVYYRVVNATPLGNYRYTWFYYSCQVDVLTADITVRTKDEVLPSTDDPESGSYQESL